MRGLRAGIKKGGGGGAAGSNQHGGGECLASFSLKPYTDHYTRHFDPLHLWKRFQTQRGSKTRPDCPKGKITDIPGKKWVVSSCKQSRKLCAWLFLRVSSYENYVHCQHVGMATLTTITTTGSRSVYSVGRWIGCSTSHIGCIGHTSCNLLP